MFSSAYGSPLIRTMMCGVFEGVHKHRVVNGATSRGPGVRWKCDGYEDENGNETENENENEDENEDESESIEA